MDSSVEHMFSVEVMVCGYHEYQSVWDAPIGEMLCDDTFVVAIKKDGKVIGHCLRKISALCSMFIRQGGKITCQVTGSRQYSSDLLQGGLEVPCKIFYTKNKSEANKMEKLIKNSLSRNIADAIIAVDTRITNHPETSTSKSQNVSDSNSMTSINLDSEEQPATVQLNSKLTLECVSLASTLKINNVTREIVASA